jgi:hypothetical protein
LLELDFEKAFDKIEHQVILKVMRHKGFPHKWLSLIKDILTTGTSLVPLNGVPGKVFHCREKPLVPSSICVNAIKYVPNQSLSRKA